MTQCYDKVVLLCRPMHMRMAGGNTMVAPSTFTGVVRGRTIELEEAPRLPRGARVVVTVVPQDQGLVSEPDGSRSHGFGALADEADALDAFVVETYRLRDLEAGRSELNP